LTGAEWALAASAFFAGLASGLLGMLSTIMRPMLAAMDGPDFRNFMEAFLRFAEHSWGLVFNYAWSIGMTIGPVVALAFLWDDPGSTSFVLTAIGLGIVVAGVLIVSNVWKTPTYNVILAWDPEAMPANWEAGRAALFHYQLDPIGGDLVGVRPISGGSGLPLGELSRKCATSSAEHQAVAVLDDRNAAGARARPIAILSPTPWMRRNWSGCRARSRRSRSASARAGGATFEADSGPRSP
jgi:hypothetical protein